MSLPTDPFTEVLEKLWEALEGHAQFRQLVRFANRIKLTERGRRPIKDKVLGADLPEVRIIPAGGSGRIYATSTSSTVVQRYAIQIATDEAKVRDKYFPLKWAIYQALSRLAPDFGLDYVEDYDLHDSRESLENLGGRGSPGWSFLQIIEVRLRFATSELQA
jgi:hypothetical protein